MNNTYVDRAELGSVQEALDWVVAEGRETGVQVVAYLDGKQVLDAWSGVADEQTARPVDGGTLFNAFSVAKAVCATALHIQAERGLVDIDAPIAEYWPEFAQNGKAGATVRHALTHRLGVPQMPVGVTPELMCNWEWMIDRLARLQPIYEPGSHTAYQSMSFGWFIGEVVRRTDPGKRPFNQFIQEEICQPLGIQDLWLGIRDEDESRIARLVNADAGNPPPPGTSLYAAATPPQVDLIPEVFERADVRRACIPGVGLITNARSIGRLFAMLANGGELDGVRLLSAERVAALNTPREHSDEADPVFFGYPIPISHGGYWLGGDRPSVLPVKNPRAICHPGAGGSIAWADLDRRFAVAICHNRMFNAKTADECPRLLIADAVREALGIR